MRLLRAFFIALFTAVVSCVVAFFVGDYLTRVGHMSDMEGGRRMFVVFVCAPLGIFAGLVVGIIASIFVRRQGATGFFIAQSWSLLIVCAVAGLLVGVPYLLSDKPPRIGGKELSLEFELRVPPQFTIPDTPSGDSVRVSLYSGNREETSAFVDWSSIKRAPEGAIIPGHVQLLTHNPERSLFAVVGSDPMAGQFITLKLPSSPRPEDEQWPTGSTPLSKPISVQSPNRRNSAPATASGSLSVERWTLNVDHSRAKPFSECSHFSLPTGVISQCSITQSIVACSRRWFLPVQRSTSIMMKPS